VTPEAEAVDNHSPDQLAAGHNYSEPAVDSRLDEPADASRQRLKARIAR
jgi:hypothetical protein